MPDSPFDPTSDGADDRTSKIQSLREMITNAERTISSAKAMLLQLEGKKKTGRPKKTGSVDEGTVVEGTFDGQIMQGTDGKQYPVPANYASKSKLVEGDLLKLTITPDGSFIYKQIGPVERRHGIGYVSQDDHGNYHVVVNGEPYRVLLASITYFRAEPGDEVAVVLPRDLSPSWVAIENILQKGALLDSQTETAGHPTGMSIPQRRSAIDDWKKDLAPAPQENPPESIDQPVTDQEKEASPLDAWVRDMEKIEKEIKSESQPSQ